jgi:hypothetical protein
MLRGRRRAEATGPRQSRQLVEGALGPTLVAALAALEPPTADHVEAVYRTLSAKHRLPLLFLDWSRACVTSSASQEGHSRTFVHPANGVAR